MNKQEILAEITELKDRLNKLEKMYDSSTLPNKRWSAEIGYSYYYITASGLIESKTEAGLALDNSRYEFGNYFRTEEEAEFEIERLKVIAELKEWATPISEFNWVDSNERKYTLEIKSTEENIHLTVAFYYGSIQTSDLCFQSEEVAKSAIESVGEDRIIKYYFRRVG
jgi:hypothetical protein